MNRLFLFITLLCLVFSGCQTSDEYYDATTDPNVWNDELWHTLLSDPTFMQISKLIDPKSFTEKIYRESSTLSTNERNSYISNIQQKRIDQLTALISIVKTKYPGYSNIYFQALYHKRHKKSSKTTDEDIYHFELEEATVAGNCSYAISVFQIIMQNIDQIKAAYISQYHNHKAAFNYNFANCDIFHRPLTTHERNGLQIIIKYHSFRYINIDCSQVLQIVKELRYAGTYLVQLRDLLEELSLNVSLATFKFPPPQTPSFPNTWNTPSKYYSAPYDKVVIKKIPLTLLKQRGSGCVTNIMAYISEILGNPSIQEIYDIYYYRKYGIDVQYSGVSSEHLKAFLTEHFVVVKKFISVEEAIKKGQVVLMDIPSSMFHSVHNILIVGYTSDGKYIYMDPEKGYLQVAKPEWFHSDHYQIPIQIR